MVIAPQPFPLVVEDVHEDNIVLRDGRRLRDVELVAERQGTSNCRALPRKRDGGRRHTWHGLFFTAATRRRGKRGEGTHENIHTTGHSGNKD